MRYQEKSASDSNVLYPDIKAPTTRAKGVVGLCGLWAYQSCVMVSSFLDLLLKVHVILA